MSSGYEYESDWKLFQKMIAMWQERYMERLLEEYSELLKEDKKASERFWELDERIKEDRKKTSVFIHDLSRSNMINHIFMLLQEGAIDMPDLADFSDGFRDCLRIPQV